LKKRTKKLLSIQGSTVSSALSASPDAFAKVFCFFFSKKKNLFSDFLPGRRKRAIPLPRRKLAVDPRREGAYIAAPADGVRFRLQVKPDHGLTCSALAGNVVSRPSAICPERGGCCMVLFFDR